VVSGQLIFSYAWCFELCTLIFIWGNPNYNTVRVGLNATQIMGVSTEIGSDRVSTHRTAEIAGTLTGRYRSDLITEGPILVRTNRSKNLALAKGVWCTIRAFSRHTSQLDSILSFRKERFVAAF
jgi:hypothetical protein